MSQGARIKRGVLERAGRIPATARIYVNRNLRMSGIEAIGFDLDYTLALYEREPFEVLAFEEAKRKLVAEGYPAEIEALRYDGSFVIRGLIVDKKRGNILKMDQHRYVARACHGTAPLPDDERKRIYQTRPIRLSGSDYVPVDTPFSLPEIDLYAQLVDFMDRTHWRRRNYRTLYDEVRGAVDRAHADGSIKDRVARDPDRFLLPDPGLPSTLHRLKTHGYRLFLLTNSDASYTSLIMNRLLSRKISPRPLWTDFFDLIVVRAGKPGFFRNRTRLQPVRLPGETRGRERGRAVTGGGVRDLERLLACGGDRILYFGDHTYGDILKSKRVRLWRTAMVIQELEHEIETRERLASYLDKLRAGVERRGHLDLLRDGLDRTIRGDAPPRMHGLRRREAMDLREGIDRQMCALEEAIRGLEEGIERAHNPHWGPLFRTDHEPSHFAAQVREFACIYTSRVSNFLHYPAEKYFHVYPEVMPHER